MLTGTGTGRVCAWPVQDSFSAPSASASSASAAAAIPSPEAAAAAARGDDAKAHDGSHFWCLPLAKGSDEGIRAICIRGVEYASI